MIATQIINNLNQNSGALQAVSTFLLVLITAYYAYQTRKTVKLTTHVKIKIDYQKGMRVTTNTTYDSTKTYFNIIVLNLSRNSVRIDQAAIKTVSPGYFILGDSFAGHRNKVLTPENPKSDFLIDQADIDFDNAWYIVVRDGFGQKHKKYLHRLPTLWFIKQKLKNWHRSKRANSDK